MMQFIHHMRQNTSSLLCPLFFYRLCLFQYWLFYNSLELHNLTSTAVLFVSDKTDKDVDMLKVQRQVRDSNSRLQNLKTRHSATEKVNAHVDLFSVKVNFAPNVIVAQQFKNIWLVGCT